MISIEQNKKSSLSLCSKREEVKMNGLVDMIETMSRQEEKYVCMKKIDNKATVTNLDTISLDQKTECAGTFVEHATQRTGICQWMLKVKELHTNYIIYFVLFLRKYHLSHQCHDVNTLKLSKGC